MCVCGYSSTCTLHTPVDSHVSAADVHFLAAFSPLNWSKAFATVKINNVREVKNLIAKHPLVNGAQAGAKRRPLRKTWTQPPADNVYERLLQNGSTERTLFITQTNWYL